MIMCNFFEIAPAAAMRITRLDRRSHSMSLALAVSRTRRPIRMRRASWLATAAQTSSSFAEKVTL